MISFEDYIQDDNKIINILCKYRAKLADKKHKNLFYNNLFPRNTKKTITSEEIERLMPPRRQWVSLNQKLRYKPANNGVKQSISSIESNILRLRITIDKSIKNGSNQEWLINLINFIDEVKKCAIDTFYKINPPITIPIRKNNQTTECRPISKFTSLRDRVILTLANKYLTVALNKYLDNESLAFRSKRLYYGKNDYITTHHDAIDRITDYRLKHSTQQIYVAECDMQKFYDSVNHSIIKREFKKILSKFQKDNPEVNVESIKNIFYKYLECYTFYKNVYNLNKSTYFWSKHNIPNGYFAWINEELINKGFCKSNRSLSRTRIGIPQGGALSGLIANIVLNIADQKVRKISNEDFLYVRYCDDMILLHTNEIKCQTILSKYILALEKLRLIPHKMENNLPFRKKRFWEIKSKSVHCWGPNGSDWIGFVGYEINRTGEIRIRKKSINKEKDKIKKIISEVHKNFHNNKRCSDFAIKTSIRYKLTSMAVGRVSLWNYLTIENELCWINGFKKLNNNKYVSIQIRDLDRTRLNAMRTLNKLLKAHQNQEIIYREKKNENIIYYGRPFSYHYHFLKNIK